MYKTLRKRYLLIIGFGVLLALLVAITAIGLSRMVAINEDMEVIVYERNVKSSLALRMHSAARERALLLNIMLIEPDPFERDELAMQFHQYASRFVEARGEMREMSLDEKEQELLTNTLEFVKEGSRTQGIVLDYITGEAFDKARLTMIELALPAQEKVLDVLNELVAYQKAASDADARRAATTYETAYRQMIALGAMAIVLGFIIAVVVIRLSFASERSQERAREAAVQAAQAKSDFLANMSHEIRTPLNAIIGMGGLLQNTELHRKQIEFVRTIVTSGESLLAVINDVLDFSKIEAGQMELEERAFDLRECIEDVLQMQASKAAAKNLELVVHLEQGVPQKLIGDEMRLRQVLLNLVGNAIKFTQHGEVVVSVAGETLSDDKLNLQIKVKDTGIGIPADRIPHLFEAFTQADSSTTRRFGGTGLGLSISSKLVGLMGGSISVDSTEGLGSIFTFNIIVEADSDVTNMTHLSSGMSGKQVLIVDDNPTNRLILMEQVVSWGMQPTAVSSGAEAIELLESGEHHFEMAVLDMQMPGMDGATLAKKIHELNATYELPLILLSSMGLVRNENVRGEFSALLTKPVKASSLYNALVQITDSGSMTGDVAAVDSNLAKIAEKMPLSLLLVEDIAVNQQVAVMMLEQMGYRVDVVENGQQAVDAVMHNQYDVVLMDVQMPVMDGLEATQEICHLLNVQERPYIIAMTANALESHRKECLDAGMNNYTSKPIEIEKLKRVLKAAYEYKLAGRMSEVESIADDFMLTSNDAETAGLDFRVLDDLKVMLGGSKEAVESLLLTYQEEAPAQLDATQQAFVAADWSALARATHGLKSSSASLGAISLSEMAKELEMAAKSDDPQIQEADVDSLIAEFASVKQAISEFLSRSA